jgi:hypothetical protein
MTNIIDEYNITECDLDKEYIDEQRQDIKYIYDSTEKINDIMKDLNHLLAGDTIKIQDLSDETISVYEMLTDTNEELHEARQKQKKTLLLKATLIGVGVGMVIGGPLGAIFGIYSGLGGGLCGILGGVTSGSIGGGASYGIFKK